jgi:hypothetical protein
MKTIIKENMTSNDFVHVQVLSMNFPKKEICVANYSDNGTDLYFYLNGESFVEIKEDSMLTEEEIRSTADMILKLIKMTGGHNNVRPGLKNFMKMLGAQFGW